MFLPLAERMVEKMVKEDKIEAEAEVSNLSPTFVFVCFRYCYNKYYNIKNCCFILVKRAGSSLLPFV